MIYLRLNSKKRKVTIIITTYWKPSLLLYVVDWKEKKKLWAREECFQIRGIVVGAETKVVLC